MQVVRTSGRQALWLLMSFGAALGGCASASETHYAKVRYDMRAGRFEAALTRVETAKESVYGQKQELLYWLDLAVLKSAAHDWPASATCFERAKEVARALYTERVRDHAESVVLGERALPYVGEPFEHVALHLLEADTYIARGDIEGARVELRAMESTLRRFNDDAKLKDSVYQDDAAGRWLSGLLRLADSRELGHLSEARIELERALDLYRSTDAVHFATAVPTQLQKETARVRAALDGSASPAATPAHATHAFATESNTARLVVLLYDGEAPHKVELEWETLLPPWQILKVAYPAFVDDFRPALAAQVTDARSGLSAPFELASDFAAKARVHLAERMESIRSHAMARAVARATAVGALQVAGAVQGSEIGALLEVISLGVNLATNAMEHADTRSWQTMPARLSIAVLPVAPGELRASVEVGGRGGVAHLEGHVEAGQTLFRSVRLD